MRQMLKKLWKDEAGVIVSAELVFIGTILIIGMIVGLVELQTSVVDELNDLGEAIGSTNQSFSTSSIAGQKTDGSIKAATSGSYFVDSIDTCDGNECAIVCVLGGVPEDYEFRCFVMDKWDWQQECAASNARYFKK